MDLLTIYEFINVSYMIESSPYISPTPGEITILAKSPYRDNYPDTITKEVFNTLESCGFNSMVVIDNIENTRKCFNTISGMNLRIVMGALGSDNYPEVRMNNMRKLVNEFHNNPSLGGYTLIDEPKFNQLEEVKNLYDMIKSIDKSHLIQINLACDFEPGSELGKVFIGTYDSMRAYLNYFQTVFKPGVWSYDYYPIQLKDGRIVANVIDFYKYMQIFFNQAKLTKRPFWAYSMCLPYIICKENETCGSNPSTFFERPVPTEGELRFEAFSALAYGAQGIVYWAYTQRDNTSLNGSKVIFLSAPIDTEGNKTSIWYEVQQVNKEIKVFNSVFCGCEVVEVTHAGQTYPGTTAFSYDMGYIRNLETDNIGVLVSHLRNNKKDYIIIVNHDPLNKQKIRLEFVDPNKVIEMSDQFEESDDVQGDSHYLTLGPGGYALFQVW